MVRALFKIRNVFAVVVFFLLLSALAFIVSGVIKSVEGYMSVLQINGYVGENSKPGMYLLEGLDLFMAAIVFVVFALGIGQLFFFDKEALEIIPKWMHINGLKDLKIILWETILVTLVVFCMTHLVKSHEKSWEILLLPAVILILSLGLYFVRIGSKGSGH